MTLPIIVALDNMGTEDALSLARSLQGTVWGFKVNDLLLAEGVSIVRRLKKYGKVFADPKLHDIPQTVANGVRRLAAAGADLITVHASGGMEMLRAAASAAEGTRTRLLAVTVLTSLKQEEVRRIYATSPQAREPARDVVLQFAKQALEAGIHGVVCSAHEVAQMPGELLKVVPGIRMPEGDMNDQQRVATPAKALKRGANLLVIGRPITAAEDPVRAVARIAKHLEESR